MARCGVEAYIGGMRLEHVPFSVRVFLLGTWLAGLVATLLGDSLTGLCLGSMFAGGAITAIFLDGPPKGVQ